MLLALANVFFALVHNNRFWHPGDYEFMIQALRIERDWGEIFARAPHNTFQPLVNAIFYLEFRAFGLDPLSYYLFNIFVHATNAFLVYLLVYTLLRHRAIAVLSGLLFVFAVGNYGKAVMVVSGISDLMITMLTLLTMLYYVRNELWDKGRLWTPNFTLCLVFFSLSLMSKATSFSILGCMLAFNLFYREQSGRRLLDKNFLAITAVALAVLVAKLVALQSFPGSADLDIFSISLLKNFASYLVRMIFPIHFSTLVENAGRVVTIVYQLASEIRALIFLCIVSYSVFGFIFGNRVIRFFIAWTYITVTPFCFFRFPSDWLNIRYLYLVSVGFSMILASGTVLAARLLYQRQWRRVLPFAIPLAFVILSRFVVMGLDSSYERKSETAKLDTIKAQFYTEYQITRGRDMRSRLE